MSNCCDASGGRVALTIDGVRYSARAALTIMPTTVEREAVANQDGTIAVTTTPQPAEMEISLSDRCGLSLDKLVNACHVDVSAEIIEMKTAWLFTRATVVGRPSIDTSTGEITGLKVVSSLVRKVDL